MKTIAAFFLAAWMAVWPCYANPLLMLAGSPPAGATEITAETAVFDGSNDYMRLVSSGPTGLADGSVFTCSFWIDLSAGDGAARNILSFGTSAAGNRFQILKTSSNVIQLFGRNSANTTILNITGSTTLTAASPAGWVHVYVCVDLTDDAKAKRKIYINGSADTITETTWTDDGVIDFVTGTDGRYSVGADAGTTPTSLLGAALAELWFNDSYLDNPSAFRSTGGHPMDIGASGSTPTGSVPVFYFSQAGSGDTWATDSGSSNTMTVTGTLGSTTSP